MGKGSRGPYKKTLLKNQHKTGNGANSGNSVVKKESRVSAGLAVNKKLSDKL